MKLAIFAAILSCVLGVAAAAATPEPPATGLEAPKARHVESRASGSECHYHSMTGHCEETSECSRGGGFYVTGECPKDAKSIKCCMTMECADGDKTGLCLNTEGSVCSKSGGRTVKNKCPGADDVECCIFA